MKSSCKTWVDAVLGFFYPNLCQICELERATHETGYVCDTCRAQPGAIRWITEPYCQRCGLPYSGQITNSFECSNCRELDLSFSFARSAAAASGLVLDTIHRYKYHRAVWFEPFLAELLIRQAKPSIGADLWDAIVPVPLHPLKEREREFNQAERLARHLARATGLPVIPGAVRRTRFTRTQTQLSRARRAENMRQAFTVSNSKEVRGKRIILLDDVLTTGATASACARILLGHGAMDVCVWTVARGVWT